MANLARREQHVFDDLFDFRRNFDHIFNRFLTRSSSTAENGSHVLVAAPPIEAWVDRENKTYHLSIALPGLDPKQVQVELQGNTLSVRGKHQAKEEKKDADYLQREFSYGRFERVIALPEGVASSKLTAEYNNGVLEITAPLTEDALPKKIEVQSSAKAKGAGA